tara:strand:+ start:338 stop:721 length:384 start_codon:yes stop_codon:yes gene_type:complete
MINFKKNIKYLNNKKFIAYFLSVIATIFIGFHIFSIKYINLNKNSSLIFIYSLAFISFFLWCISRIIIYYASNQIPITIIHIILNLSVIVTALLSAFVLKTKINWIKFTIGFLFVFIGVFSVDRSII